MNPRLHLLLDRIGATGSLICAIHCALIPLAVALLPSLGVALWLAVLYPPLHHSVVMHAVVMTFGGTLVGLAHLANLRLTHGHVHDATCAHSH